MRDRKTYLSNERLQRVKRAWKYIKPWHRAKLYLFALWWSLPTVIDVRAWRKFPTLRPRQMIMPAALLQVVVFLLAAVTPGHFLIKFAASNFIIAAGLMLPLTLQPDKGRVHWVRPQK